MPSLTLLPAIRNLVRLSVKSKDRGRTRPALTLSTSRKKLVQLFYRRVTRQATRGKTPCDNEHKVRMPSLTLLPAIRNLVTLSVTTRDRGTTRPVSH